MGHRSDGYRYEAGLGPAVVVSSNGLAGALAAVGELHICLAKQGCIVTFVAIVLCCAERILLKSRRPHTEDATVPGDDVPVSDHVHHGNQIRPRCRVVMRVPSWEICKHRDTYYYICIPIFCLEKFPNGFASVQLLLLPV